MKLLPSLLSFVLLSCVTVSMARAEEEESEVAPIHKKSTASSGGKIAFASNFEIYVMNADGTNQTRLTAADNTSDVNPSFSSDGQKIVYASGDNQREIYVMNADGSNPIRLTHNSVWDFNPCFSPDGKKIAFVSLRKGDPVIYVMDANGANQIRLTDAGADYPNFSPDGKKIVFSLTRGYSASRNGPSEVVVMGIDGRKQTRLAKSAMFSSFPCFSPDGKTVVFTDRRNGHPILCAINADGTGATRFITRGNNDEIESCFSPDGKKIAFVSYGDAHNIYVMNADGTGQTQVSSGDFDLSPTWASGFVPAPKAAPK